MSGAPRIPEGVRSFSYGGGTQSTAALVLAARGEIDFPVFAFANVGDDSENPASLEYVRDIAMPYAALHGIELVELKKNSRYPSLLSKMKELESSLPIPVRMDETGAPAMRSCTQDWKVDVLAKELRRRGATPTSPAVVGLGITVDEIERVRSELDPKKPEQRRRYPLIDLGMTRQDCLRVIADEGLPLPERSACWFCPYHSGEEWRRLQTQHPDLFEQACSLEELLQARRKKLGRGPVWISSQGAKERTTLRVLHEHDQIALFDSEGSCDGGYCMT